MRHFAGPFGVQRVISASGEGNKEARSQPPGLEPRNNALRRCLKEGSTK